MQNLTGVFTRCRAFLYSCCCCCVWCFYGRLRHLAISADRTACTRIYSASPLEWRSFEHGCPIMLTPSRPVLATPFHAKRQAGEQHVPSFNVFRYDAAGDRTTNSKVFISSNHPRWYMRHVDTNIFTFCTVSKMVKRSSLSHSVQDISFKMQ